MNFFMNEYIQIIITPRSLISQYYADFCRPSSIFASLLMFI